jgi:hypothetical protein
MAKIIEENRKTLRQAMQVRCKFSESADAPTSITPFGDMSDYEALANLSWELFPEKLMDLSGDGFLNDGQASPMDPSTDSFRYGYISSNPARGDGSFSPAFGVTIQAAQNWDVVTLELLNPDGTTKTVQYDPIWIGGAATINIENWTPGEKASIIGIYLGRTWTWDNSSLLGVDVDLRAVNTELGGELETSSIEIQAYEPTDYTDVIGRIPVGAPISYIAGYVDDMSQVRNFYLSESIEWEDNILTVRGQDATMFLDNKTVPVDCDNYGDGWYIDHVIVDRIREALSDISYREIGSAPDIQITGPQPILYEEKAARSVVSEYTGLFRDLDFLRVTYVDAGIPTLTIGQIGRKWDIYADEIEDIGPNIEQNIREIRIVLPEYYMQYNDSIDKIKATNGRTYFVKLDPPVPYQNINISPTPTSSQEINCSMFKFKAAASTEYTLSGYPMLEDLIDANNPYSVSNNEKGISERLDFTMPLFEDSGGNSITKASLPELLKRSNITYEITFRGNPHIQPRDITNVQIARWVDANIDIDGLWPETDLYPSETLYPDATYKKGRKMITEWVTMTVDSLTLEHGEGGGLSSKIIARKGAV